MTISLPPKGPTQINGEFIIVKSGGDFRLGVSSVKPNATIVYMNAGNFLPVFENNKTPFSSQSMEEGNLIASISGSCAAGAYRFNMTDGSQETAGFPYTIHVHASGSQSANYLVRNGKLVVLLFVNGEVGKAVSIDFRKEGFSDAVGLTFKGEGTETKATIPAENADGLWTVTPSSLPSVRTIIVGSPTIGGQDASPNSHHFEVVGSDEGDLVIVPPPED